MTSTIAPRLIDPSQLAPAAPVKVGRPRKPRPTAAPAATEAAPATPPAPMPTGDMSRLVATIEACYAAIRANHPDLPDVMVVVGQGTHSHKDGMTYGHVAPERWQHGARRVHELMVSGEGLKAGAKELLNTLLHEPCHLLARVRGIKDTSRSGNRYHNARFAALAREVGLCPPEKPTALGFSACTLPEETWALYTGIHAKLDEACRVYRHVEVRPGKATGGAEGGEGEGDEGETATAGKRVKAECECGRKMWMSRSVFVQAVTICGACMKPFVVEGIELADEPAAEGDDEDNECEGHESVDAPMGVSVFCDGTCKRPA